MKSQVVVAQNTSKVLQDPLKTTYSELKKFERQQHKLEQHSRRECLAISGIPSSDPSADLENLVICVLQEIICFHWLRRTDRTTVKFLKRKNAETVFLNKKKLEAMDISCLISNGIHYKNGITTGDQNGWKDGRQSRKR